MSFKHHLKIQQIVQLFQSDLSDPPLVCSQLVSAVQQLTKRGLVYSARWCAELLFSLQSKAQECSSSNANVLFDSRESEQKDSLAFVLARRYFDCREYRRCAECLKNLENETCVFLRCYSLFLTGEKERLDGSIQVCWKSTVRVPLFY